MATDPAPGPSGPPGVPLLHADEAWLVLDKPAGLPSVPGRAPGLQDCVATRVQAWSPGALVVHRLDMATSGLMLMARSADVQRRLGDAFARRAVDKRYIAIVAGEPASDAGEIDLPLAADWPNRPRQIVDPIAGRPSLTRWRVLERHGDRSRVELQPLTGRSHQLRVHLAAIGHPILGDSLYAPAGVQTLAPRLLLHAAGLMLAHPLDGRDCRFDSPPPF